MAELIDSNSDVTTTTRHTRPEVINAMRPAHEAAGGTWADFEAGEGDLATLVITRGTETMTISGLDAEDTIFELTINDKEDS